MQIATAVDVTVDFRYVELSDILDLLVCKAYDLPASVEPIPIEISVTGDEVAVRRVKAVSIKMHFRSTDLMGFLLFSDGELGMRIYLVLEPARNIYSRCDLHPRWRPDGKMIGFNSVHEGYRQVYVMDVKNR